MSYTNNIYIPYVEGFHNEDLFTFYKDYYEGLGFLVNKLSYNMKDEINYIDLINELLTKKEEIFIFIDYIILHPFAINQSINLAKENNCLIKPSTKMYLIKGYDQWGKILNSIKNEDYLENFYYDVELRFRVWPLDSAWVFNKNSFNSTLSVNNNLSGPTGYDFDLLYKESLFNKVIFVESDSYKFNPILANVNENISFIYNKYIDSLINLFGKDHKVFLYKNQILEKVEKEKCQEVIFNSEKYFSLPRYI